MNKNGVQNLSDARKAMGNVQRVLRMKQSGRPKRKNVTLRDEASHAQGGCSTGASIPGIACMPENVINRHVKSAF